mmetsp:Transcript_1263/g.3000  ORF Transcript_1263/g.3000 Transcript_1263/m.3000 type:complete len:311 (-) Transcript_1263:9-941(-)
MCCPCLLPIWGMLMFTISPKLWVHMALPFLVAIVGTLAALYLLWEYVEKPQMLALEKLALPASASLVLSVVLIPVEAALINLVLFHLLFGQVAGKITATVLKDRGAEKKLRDWYGVQELSDTGAGPLDGICSSAFFVVLQLILMIATSPMHVVAGPGQVAWIAVNGWVRTWDLVAEQLPVIGFRFKSSQFSHVLRRAFSYVAFGAVAFAFELLPFANIFLVGGNAYGAALLYEGFLDSRDQGPDGLPLPTNNVSNSQELRARSLQPMPRRPPLGNGPGALDGNRGYRGAGGAPQAPRGAPPATPSCCCGV